MSVTQATNRWEYTPANGVTQLPYTRKIFANTDLKVYKNGTPLTLTTQYTVDGVGSVNGGNVTLVVAANGTDKFVVLAVVTLDQQTVYPSNDKFPAKVHEDGLDKLTMAAQQLNEVDTRTLRIKDTAFESGSSLELNQSKTARASKVLGFDANGDVTTSVPGADAAAASAAAAATSATNASNSAAAAAASAAAAGLPGSLAGAATKMLRVKADESGYELRTQAQVRADVSAAASGPVTGSGLTIATSRLAGRTTAGAGALEEITVGAGLSLAAGALTATGGGSAPQAGQLQYVSGTSVKFVPYGGAAVRIAGTDYAIPAAGVASGNPTTGSNYVNGVAAQALAASTTYLVCVFNNGGALTLDFLTTLTHVQDTAAGNVGVEIKSGDNTRTVVGMVRTNATPNFVDSDAQRFTLSWFNRRRRALLNAFAANRSTGSVSYAELSSTERIEFLIWSGESMALYVSGAGEHGTVGSANWTSIGIDDATAEDAATSARGMGAGAGNEVPIHVNLALSGLVEGYHYATVVGKTSGPTMTWYGGATPGLRTTIGGTLNG